jgi:ABC-type transport system substrate-binding protein
MFPNTGAFNEPDLWLSQIYSTGAARNYVGFSDSKVDMLIERQRTTFDLNQRKAVIREIVTYMVDHYPGVIGSNILNLNAVSPKVQDYSPERQLSGRQYEWVWLET